MIRRIPDAELGSLTGEVSACGTELAGVGRGIGAIRAAVVTHRRGRTGRRCRPVTVAAGSDGDRRGVTVGWLNHLRRRGRNFGARASVAIGRHGRTGELRRENLDLGS